MTGNEDIQDHSISKIPVKNQVTEIVDKLADFLRTKYIDEGGNTPRFASIQDLQIDQLSEDQVLQIVVNLDLHSDLGDWEQKLIIRQFETFSELEAELDRYALLEARCLLFPYVNLMPIIDIDQSFFRLIYEVPRDSHPLEKLKTTPKLHAFTLGKVAAILQGDDKEGLNQTSIRSIIELVLSQIPFSEEEAFTISNLLEPHYPIIDRTIGGYIPLTAFDPNGLRFKLNKSKDSESNPISIFVPISEPADEFVDRMSDIAVIFGIKAYEEFIQTGRVDETKRRIKHYFEGYNSVKTKVGDIELEQLYPNGITLDLQMMLIFCLMELGKPNPFTTDDSNRYLYFLLLKKPFIVF